MWSEDCDNGTPHERNEEITHDGGSEAADLGNTEDDTITTSERSPRGFGREHKSPTWHSDYVVTFLTGLALTT